MGERDLRSEINALKEIGKNGGYSLACRLCGAEESRVVAQLIVNEVGEVVIGAKTRVCDDCSADGLANVMIERDQ